MLSDVLHKLLYNISNQWTWWWAAINNEDELIRAVVLTLSILSLSIFYYLWTFLSSRNRISAPLPPGPLGLPIVGYLPLLGTNLHQSFTELAQQYGPIYKLRLGKKLCVVLNSPSLAKGMVRDRDTVLPRPSYCCISLYIQRIRYRGAPYGSYWRTLPKVFVREMLSNTSLEDTYSLRREEVRKTIRDLHNRIGMGVDIGEISFLTAFNVVMSMLWGGTADRRRAESVGTEFQAAMLRIVDLLGKPNVSDFFPILARFDLQVVIFGTFVLLDKLYEMNVSDHQSKTEANLIRPEQQAAVPLRDSSSPPPGLEVKTCNLEISTCVHNFDLCGLGHMQIYITLCDL